MCARTAQRRDVEHETAQKCHGKDGAVQQTNEERQSGERQDREHAKRLAAEDWVSLPPPDHSSHDHAERQNDDGHAAAVVSWLLRVCDELFYEVPREICLLVSTLDLALPIDRANIVVHHPLPLFSRGLLSGVSRLTQPLVNSLRVDFARLMWERTLQGVRVMHPLREEAAM